MNGDEKKKAREILAKLKKSRSSAVFFAPIYRAPISTEGYGAVVKKVIDLSEVVKRLNNNSYNAFTDYVQDVMLVFTNTYAFFPSNSLIHVVAESLQCKFLRLLSKLQSPTEAAWARSFKELVSQLADVNSAEE